LNDKPGTIASKARLSRPHTEGLLNVLIKIGKHNYKLDRYLLDILISKLKDESNAQKAGLIRRETGFPNSLNETIYSGPNIHLGNPLYQTPRRICNTKGSYDSLDMELIPSNYLPRTNYVSAVSEIAYLDSLPRFTSKKGKYISDYYRIGLREMLSDSWERTTLVTIFPKALTHISTLVSICFASYDLAQRFGALASSLPFDFLVRSSGAGHANKSFITTLPIYTNSVYSKMASLRFLLLNCVTDHYSELWSECWSTDFQNDKWLQNDLRLPKNRFLDLNEKWIRKTGSRNAFERRQLLIELDILAAKELKLSLDELCSIYRTHFPVLFQNENDTWYDQNGRIVFTCSKGLSGVGFSRTEWNEVKNIKSGTVDRIIEDDTVADYRYANTCIVLDDGNTINCPCPDYPAPIRGPVKRIVTYAAPFTKSNREQDYRTAWVEFDKRGLVIA